MPDLAEGVVVALRNRYTRSVVLDDEQQGLWGMLADAADLTAHRQAPKVRFCVAANAVSVP